MSNTIVEGATWAWENRKSVRQGLKRLYKWFTTDGRGVLVLGAGGTGKSTFGRVFSGQSQGLFERLADYEESVGPETVAFEGHGGLEVSILPGQEHRRVAVWPKFTEGISAGKYRGVLLFSSFGFHSLGQIRYRDTAPFRKGMRVREFVERYTELKRDQEIQVLNAISPFISAAKEPIWLFQVVTKEDLWWDRRQDVHRWYNSGPYNDLINRVKSVRGSDGIHVETAYVSFLIRNLETGPGEMLAKTVSGYDQALQLASLRRFCRSVGRLTELGAAKMKTTTQILDEARQHGGRANRSGLIELLKEYTSKLEALAEKATALREVAVRESTMAGDDFKPIHESTEFLRSVIADRVTGLSSHILTLSCAVSQLIDNGKFSSATDQIELQVRLADLEGALESARNLVLHPLPRVKRR